MKMFNYIAIALVVVVVAMFPAFGLCQQSRCMPKKDSLELHRDTVFQQIVRARTRLEAYDAVLARYSKSTKPDIRYTGLNMDREEILVTAMNAYFFSGPQAYPTDNDELSMFVDSLSALDLDYLLWPARLEELVDCGILPHLPASPYSTGNYLSELPETSQPGDVCYMPIPINNPIWHPDPGCYEGELLLIFDRVYEGNMALLDAAGLAEGSYGDYTKYFKAEQYDNICYILLNDRDEAEKDRLKP